MTEDKQAEHLTKADSNEREDHESSFAGLRDHCSISPGEGSMLGGAFQMHVVRTS
jgi:hypothetical protein